MITDTPYCMVISTCPDKESALKVANKIIDSKLAACVSILPNVISVYRWQGETQSSDEVLLMIKTLKQADIALQTLILEIHPYELPEIVSVPFTGGLSPYLDWISDNVSLPQPAVN